MPMRQKKTGFDRLNLQMNAVAREHRVSADIEMFENSGSDQRDNALSAGGNLMNREICIILLYAIGPKALVRSKIVDRHHATVVRAVPGNFSRQAHLCKSFLPC